MGMKRFVIGVLVLAIGCSAAVAGAVANPSVVANASVPKAKLRGFLCQTARDPANRGIDVTAVMRPLSHTVKMALRFDLLVRQSRTGPASMVVYGSLGKWIYPKNKTLGQRPGDQFIVSAPVSQLSTAPANYRFRVTFRWTGAHGHVIGTAVRYSPGCFQPELRPDLQVASIGVQLSATNPRRDIYSAHIRNAGASAAGPFDVQFSDGSVVRSKTIQLLGPHSKTIVVFGGPLCDPAAPPTVTADPTGQIDDFNRANNTLTATCPAP
jgi:CARDB